MERLIKVGQVKPLKALKEVYEECIKDIKQSAAERIQSLKRDEKILVISICALGILLIGALLLDLFIGSVGWFGY